MSFPGGTTHLYKEPPLVPTRESEQFQVFLGTVQTVDYERQVCTVMDTRSKVIHTEVAVIPCVSSSFESTDVYMPERGGTCLCVPLFYYGGHSQVAIIGWAMSHIVRARDSVAMRELPGVSGLNERKRGNYRKAYPGQHTASYSQGYTERVNPGWDKASSAFDRENVDPDSRTWSTITSRQVGYSDAGMTFKGPVVRPDAPNITPSVLPDASREWTLYLQPKAVLTDRYVSGKPDVLPFSENTTRVQEFALDYPLPSEVLQTDLLDSILGTTQNPWTRTTITTQGNFKVDNTTYFATQEFDHPTDPAKHALGPTLNEGPTPLRKGFILERSEGTLVGFNRFDKLTYGQVLKPVLSPLTGLATPTSGRFGADFTSGYMPVTDTEPDHIEARLAASCHSVRFPSEYNTTRWDVSKEGMLTFEVGSTMPKENIQFLPVNAYEHPHGAGRSVEGHLVGSLKLVVGKNRDEEDAIDLQALGQSVLRFGCDDTSLPDAGRSVKTQIRGSKDASQQRTLQYWASPKFGLGDPGNLANKTGMERVSIRMATDGAVVARLGARADNSTLSVPVRRRHLKNGYSDPQGIQFDLSTPNSHSPGRQAYAAGDASYQFHDLTTAGQPTLNMVPYNSWMGNPVLPSMDAHGMSLDLHAVRDVLLRIGKNPSSGQSLLLDLDGGIVLAAGKDKQGRSLTGSLEGGIELTVGQSSAKKGLRLEITGDVDWMVHGNLHQHVTGDFILECKNFRHITKLDHVVTAQNINHTALSAHVVNSPQILNNSGTTVMQKTGY
jgi:hypothetical protein